MQRASDDRGTRQAGTLQKKQKPDRDGGQGFEDSGALAAAREQRGQHDGRQHGEGEFVRTEARQHGHRYRLADRNCTTPKMSAF